MKASADIFLADVRRPIANMPECVLCDAGHVMMEVDVRQEKRAERYIGIPSFKIGYCEPCDRYRRVIWNESREMLP